MKQSYELCDNCSINYKRVSPTKFKIIIAIDNKRENFIFPLSFKVKYNRNWEIYPYMYHTHSYKHKSMSIVQNSDIIDGHIFETFFRKSIGYDYYFLNKKEMMIFIDIKYIKNNFKDSYAVSNHYTYLYLTMEYKPQKVYIVGIIISTLTILFFTIIFLFTKKKYIE